MIELILGGAIYWIISHVEEERKIKEFMEKDKKSNLLGL